MLTLLAAQATPTVELAVTLGVSERLPARLLAVRVPQEVADQRRRRLHEAARKKGQAVSRERLALCNWTGLVTNVPPARLTVREALVLARARWPIELAFKLIKTQLKRRLLWGASPVMVLPQVWAVLIIAQVRPALRVEIAGRAGVDPYAVSLPLLVKYLPYLAARGLDPVATMVERGRAMRVIRPSSRRVIVAPEVAREAITPVPPDLELERIPRYAERKCGPRACSAA